MIEIDLNKWWRIFFGGLKIVFLELDSSLYSIKYMTDIREGLLQGRIKVPRGPGPGPGAGPPHPTPLVSARLVVIATLLAHFQ